MKIENYKRIIADEKIEHYLKLFGTISDFGVGDKNHELV